MSGLSSAVKRHPIVAFLQLPKRLMFTRLADTSRRAIFSVLDVDRASALHLYETGEQDSDR